MCLSGEAVMAVNVEVLMGHKMDANGFWKSHRASDVDVEYVSWLAYRSRHQLGICTLRSGVSKRTNRAGADGYSKHCNIAGKILYVVLCRYGR
jgi:hypothetical protein